MSRAAEAARAAETAAELRAAEAAEAGRAAQEQALTHRQRAAKVWVLQGLGLGLGLLERSHRQGMGRLSAVSCLRVWRVFRAGKCPVYKCPKYQALNTKPYIMGRAGKAPASGPLDPKKP